MFDNKLSVYHDPLDLTSFNLEVPTPDAVVDICQALKEYNCDVQNIHFIYSNNAEQSLETNWRVLINHRDWALFWSQRHPYAAERAKADRELHVLERSIARIAAKARACLERRMQQ